MKNQNRTLLISVGVIVIVVMIAVVTALFIPQETNPAFATAVDFVNAVSQGNDVDAMSQLSDDLQAYVTANCPDGSASACVRANIPDEWGAFQSAVYRRSQPDGANAWDIQLIATYSEGQGFSGVCIYTRAERFAETWKIARWSGFVSCDLPNSGLQGLMADDAPNRVP